MTPPAHLVKVVASSRCTIHPEQATCGAPSKAVGHFVCALANVPDGWAKVNGEWVQVAQADRYDVEGPSGVIDGANVLVTLPQGDEDRLARLDDSAENFIREAEEVLMEMKTGVKGTRAKSSSLIVP